MFIDQLFETWPSHHDLSSSFIHCEYESFQYTGVELFMFLMSSENVSEDGQVIEVPTLAIARKRALAVALMIYGMVYLIMIKRGISLSGARSQSRCSLEIQVLCIVQKVHDRTQQLTQLVKD